MAVRDTPRCRPTIALCPPNTITLLCLGYNMMLFFAKPGIGLSRRGFGRLDRPHFRTQAFDEVLDVKRQRRSAFHRNISVEPGRLDYAQQFDAGVSAVRD